MRVDGVALALGGGDGLAQVAPPLQVQGQVAVQPGRVVAHRLAPPSSVSVVVVITYSMKSHMEKPARK